MHEILPVMAGVAIGLIMPRMKRSFDKLLVFSLLSVICGVTASWITGELRVSWVYLLIDIAQVAASGSLIWALAVRWRRRVPGRERA